MKHISHLAELGHLFRPGCRVVMHSACAAPPRLGAQLVELAQVQGPFELFDLTTIGNPTYVSGVAAGSLKLSTFVPGRAVRSALRAGCVTVLRRPLSAAPSLLADGTIGVDVLLLHVSPPDAEGRMSLGVSCDAMRAALSRDPVVVVEVNEGMPRTFGTTSIDSDEVDHWLEGDGSPVTVAPATGDATDDAIADHVAGLIRNGDVLQTGIGSIPDLTASRLTHLRDLGIHTGIITDAVQTLIERGVVTNAGKTEFHGKSVATLAGGSAAFYRFLDGNPDIVFIPCDESHDAARLARIPQLCAINGALEIDLHGRINAESADGQQVSAPGGQPDFARGASASAGGKSIIALRATSKDGATSRIVRSLAPGANVTISTQIVDYVVTEHGVARVAGLSGIQLATALADIAAPEFRSNLRRT